MIKMTWLVIVDNLDLIFGPVTSDDLRGSMVFPKYRYMFILRISVIKLKIMIKPNKPMTTYKTYRKCVRMVKIRSDFVQYDNNEYSSYSF